MATVRIYKVAELLGTTSQEVSALLKRDHGIEVKSASSTIEEVVARQFVERLARQRNISLPGGDMFAETPVVKGKKGVPAKKPAEPAKPAAPPLPPPRLVKTAKPVTEPATEAEAEALPADETPARNIPSSLWKRRLLPKCMPRRSPNRRLSRWGRSRLRRKRLRPRRRRPSRLRIRRRQDASFLQRCASASKNNVRRRPRRRCRPRRRGAFRGPRQGPNVRRARPRLARQPAAPLDRPARPGLDRRRSRCRRAPPAPRPGRRIQDRWRVPRLAARDRCPRSRCAPNCRACRRVRGCIRSGRECRGVRRCGPAIKASVPRRVHAASTRRGRRHRRLRPHRRLSRGRSRLPRG